MRQYTVLCILLLAPAAMITAQNVGINTTTPEHPAHINQPSGDTLTDYQPVMHVEYTGTNLADMIAVTGKCRPADWYGYGGVFEGGYTGVQGIVEATGSSSYIGVQGLVSGGTGLKYAVRGLATGNFGTKVGIFGTATGGGTNWAGYFGSGNVYIANRLGISTETPAHPVHINQPSGTTLSDEQSVMYAEYTGTNLADVIAVRGICRPADYYGIGGYFEGGYTGVQGTVEATGSSSYFGVQGFVSGGTGLKYAVRGLATGSAGTNYGVFGAATGGGINWAGYFANGNVHIANRLGIATETPEHPVHIVHASSLSDNEPVMHVEFTGTNTADAIAVRGKSRPADYYGVGGEFEGGYIGVRGKVVPTGPDEYYGVHGEVLGGSGTNYGVYGAATGDGTNWAGFFSGGNVYIHNRLGINRSPVTNRLEVNGNASKSSAGDWLANSDARLKKNIRHLDSGEMLEKLLTLEGISYEWDDQVTGSFRPEGTHMGFTAQNIQQVFPDLVEEDNLGYLQTAYGTYDPVVVEAIRALSQTIAILEKGNTQLNEMIALLHLENAELKEGINALNEKVFGVETEYVMVHKD